jgi:3-oxoacyl-[acyl-carrier protein] reductase
MTRRVVVLGADGPVGRSVADGLTAASLDVLVADAGIGSGSEIAKAISEVAPTGVRAIVDTALLSSPPPVGELASLDADAWTTAAEAPLKQALHVLQAAHLCLRDDGGRIVILLPSLITNGSAGLAAWTAAAEGYRAMSKAAARAWGGEGITVNCVLVPADLAVGESVDRPGLQPPALGRAPEILSDVAPVVAGLLGDDFAAITGMTIAVDGGVWMTP